MIYTKSRFPNYHWKVLTDNFIWEQRSYGLSAINFAVTGREWQAQASLDTLTKIQSIAHYIFMKLGQLQEGQRRINWESIEKILQDLSIPTTINCVNCIGITKKFNILLQQLLQQQCN
jgi:hypothetical protein